MARSVAAGKANHLSRLPQFARNESGQQPANAEKYRSRLGGVSAPGKFPDVLFAQQKLSKENARRARANARARRIFHRLSLRLPDSSHQPLRSRLYPQR